MIEYLKTILTGQFEAALCMLNDCVRKCPQEHWEGKIANDTFRQVAYHTLFFVDLYLSPGEAAFQLRDCHRRGGDERSSTEVSSGLSREETLSYLAICRQKALETLASETPESLQRESGFSWLPFSRGELHLYNIRHVQHHTGQLSAYLRRLVQDSERWWVKTGWR
ncbi:MAG TPA: DinB family protein [Planctomycetaceae bacterium]|nr:DinB family protein [Planctomycetaceae bacterium]